MKFSIGDPVLLLRTGEEGVLVGFLADGLVEVKINSICIPVHHDEIDHPYFIRFTTPKPTQRINKAHEKTEKVETRAQRPSQGVYLSFFPDFDEVAVQPEIKSLRIFLLNETTEALRFDYAVRAADKSLVFSHSGTINSFGKILLHTLSLESMNTQPRFHWSLSPANRDGQTITDILRIRSAQLAKQIEALIDNNLPSFSIHLRTPPQYNLSISGTAALIPAEAIQLSGSGNQREVFKYSMPAEKIIDLHVDHLILIGEDMSGDILAKQLSYLEKMLHAAVLANLSEMLIVHGVGTGILRTQVHKFLHQSPLVKDFGHDYLPGYGVGATRVWF